MAGVREQLILDITQAQRQVDTLENQLTNAFAGVAVEVDTAGISREISNAVAAADTQVAVEVDSAGVAGEITSAVDAADSTLRVEADTTGVSAEISRAVEVADADVTIGADTTLARAQVRALNTDIQETSASAGALGVALSGAALLAGARGLFALASASSAVNEQVTGSEIVFKEYATTVQQFADQAQNIGIGEAQALQLSNTFGQLALSAGLAGAQVSDFATTIVTRAADIASLRDLDLTQTLEALRSGLVGETEPLRNLGIFLNEANVATEAYRSGITELGAELTDAEKIQARYNLILEQSEIAAGNFALTSEGLANRQRSVSAAFQNLAADAGSIIEPAFLRLADTAEGRLIPTLEELAEGALPAVGSILESLAPVLGITLNLLVAATPVLELTADVIGAIPAPLFAAAAAYIAFNRAQRLATSATQIDSVQRLGQSLTGLRTGFANAGAGVQLLAGSGAVLASFVAIALKGEDAGGALGSLAGGVLQLGDSFTNFAANRNQNVSEEVTALLAGLDPGLASDAQIGVERLTEALSELDAGVRLFSVGGTDVFASNSGADDNERIKAIRAQIDALNLQARAEVQTGIDTGRFTQAQIDATKAQADREGVASPIIRQLELLQIAEEQAAIQAKQTIETYADLANSYTNIADKSRSLLRNAPQVAAALRQVRDGGDPSTFLDLAVAIDGANLSAEDLSSTAALLGTDVDTLKGFVDSATGSLESFIDAAVGGLPTVSAVLGEVQDQVQAREDDLAAAQERTARDVTASVGQFAQGLRDKAAELADFREDLQVLTFAGFSDLAGLLAEQGFDAGDAFADQLRTALETGNLDILNSLRTANETFKAESESTIAFISEELAPQYLSATGILASAITTSFGEGLDFEEKMRIAGELAKLELDTQGQAIAAIAAVEGEDAAREYGAALKLDQQVIDAAVAAGTAIKTNAPTADAKTAGEATGFAFIDGAVAVFEVDQKLKEAARALAQNSVVRPIRDTLDMRSPSRVAMELGGMWVEGLVVGINSSAGRAAASSQSLGVRVGSALAGSMPSFAVRPQVQTLAGGAGATALDDATILKLAAAIGGQMVPTITVNNPRAATAESSIRRELTSVRLRSGGG
jgi:hypothetical protein